MRRGLSPELRLVPLAQPLDEGQVLGEQETRHDLEVVEVSLVQRGHLWVLHLCVRSSDIMESGFLGLYLSSGYGTLTITSRPSSSVARCAWDESGQRMPLGKSSSHVRTQARLGDRGGADGLRVEGGEELFHRHTYTASCNVVQGSEKGAKLAAIRH